MTMTRYVAGFMFSANRDVLALVRKNRPAWQRNKFNGIGGKIEPGELASAAMAREFFEETGVRYDGWEYFTTLRGPDWEVVFYRAFSDVVYDCWTVTDEAIGLVDPTDLPDAVVPNLRWLVPMALHAGDLHVVTQAA